MKGYTRQIDEQGRVVLPIEARRSLHIATGDEIEIEMVPGGILLSPVKASCGVCGSMSNLHVIQGIAICADCGKELYGYIKQEEAK